MSPMLSPGCCGAWTRLSKRALWSCSHLKNMVTRDCWLARCNPALAGAVGASGCASACKARPAVLCDRWLRSIPARRMTTIRNLFRRRDTDGIDDYFPPRSASIKSLLFQLVPTRYRAQRYNRQLRRDIEENPNGALVVWERENSSKLYHVFPAMAG